MGEVTEKGGEMKYEKRVTQITVAPENQPIWSEQATQITIDDESGGEYLKIVQHHEGEGFLLTPEEWPAIKEAIEEILSVCRSYP